MASPPFHQWEGGRYASGLSIRSALRTPAGVLGLPLCGRHPFASLSQSHRFLAALVEAFTTYHRLDSPSLTTVHVGLTHFFITL